MDLLPWRWTAGLSPQNCTEVLLASEPVPPGLQQRAPPRVPAGNADGRAGGAHGGAGSSVPQAAG